MANSRLLFQLAHEHYVDGLSHKELADKHGYSDVHIGRLLKMARSSGIAEVALHPPLLDDDLEDRLRHEYPTLRKVIIIPTVEDYSYQLKYWGKVSADYFHALLKEKGPVKVGISGGMTLFEMIMALPTEGRKDVDFYATAILGRCNESVSHIAPTTLVTLAWVKSGAETGRSHFVTLSPYEPGKRKAIERQLASLASKDFAQRYLQELRQIDIALVSVGLIDFDGDINEKYRFTMTRLLQPNGITPDALIQEGAVGDMNYSFFDAEGKTRPAWRFFMGLDVDFFAAMARDPSKTVIAIAGAHKEGPLRAALQRGLFNIWVTDEETAKKLDPARKIIVRPPADGS